MRDYFATHARGRDFEEHAGAHAVGHGESRTWLPRCEEELGRGALLRLWHRGWHCKIHPGEPMARGGGDPVKSHAIAATRKIRRRTYGVFLNAPITFI